MTGALGGHDETGKEAPNLNESRLARPAKEKSNDASVAALSETVADLRREIAKAVIAIDQQREPESRSPSGGKGSGKKISQSTMKRFAALINVRRKG